MWRAALLALCSDGSVVLAQVRNPPNCAFDHEDCSHSGQCCDGSKQCYKKDVTWAGCRDGCTPGIHEHDPPEFKTDWSCDSITPNHPDCAAKEENCGHLGCCKDAGFTCFEKNRHWAQCLQSCEHDREVGHHHDPYWKCTEIHPHGGGGAPGPSPSNGGPPPTGDWHQGLASTHFWDCNGAACDAVVLQPFKNREYKYAPHYAPLNPEKFGGATYGEKIWMTGAASDALSDMLGPDREFCGVDNEGGGGCGQCTLVRNQHAVNKDWTAVVMKKNRCPPESNGCQKPNMHMDFAVPGFDHLGFSLSNSCGSGEKSNTYINKQQSGICGQVMPHKCDCSQLPSGSAEQRILKEGCELFQTWGWFQGSPKLEFKPVECPEAFVETVRIGKAFDHNGVISMYDNSTALAFHEYPASPGARRRALLNAASPLLLGAGVLLIAFRAWSSGRPQKSPADSEELLELQPDE